MRNVRALELGALFWVYGTMAFLSLLLDFFSHGSPLWSWTHSTGATRGQWVGGSVFIVIYILVTSPLPKIFKWASELERVFRQILTPFSYLQIVILAILSGVVEEWFFRGVLLNHFGLIFSSIIFGLCHFIPARSVWTWSFLSTLMGVILGLFYQHTGSLGLVAFIHGAINGAMLWKLNGSAHRRPAMG